MEFSINVQDVIKMSLDTVNGNLNFHFLKRLLEAVVVHSGLNKYEMSFTGQDAIRAQQVWSGGPDPDEKPLLSEFSIKPDKVYNLLSEEKSDETLKVKNEESKTEHTDNMANEDVEETLKITKIKDNKIRGTEYEVVEDDGTLNLKVLKKVEKMMHVRHFINENENPFADVDSKNTRHTVHDVVNQLKSLTSRVNNFERMLKTIPTVYDSNMNNLINSPKSSAVSSSSSNLSKSQKTVRMQLPPSDIIQPKELSINEIIVSKNRQSINLGSAKDIKLIDGSIRNNINQSSSLSIDENEIDDNDLFSSYISNKITSLATSEKYILKNHKPIILMKHIEKLLSRMNKVEYEIKMLLEVCKPESTSIICSEIGSDHTLDEVRIDENENSDFQESVKQKKILKKLSRTEPTKFQSVFGLSTKKRDLDGYLSIRNFHSFFEDYTHNFQIIYDFLTFHNEMIKHNVSVLGKKLDLQEHLEFKKTVKETNLKIKNDIKEHIIRDPEAAGIVQFMKGVTCMSCAKPVMMKTTNASHKNAIKGVMASRPCLKAHLTYELDLVRKQNIRMPDANDLDLNTCKCVTPSPARDCNIVNNKNVRGHTVIVNELIRTTPLERWIHAKTPAKCLDNCGMKYPGQK